MSLWEQGLSSSTDTGLSVMVPSSLFCLQSFFSLKPFYTFFILSGEVWVTLVIQTMVLQSWVENTFLTERWKTASSGKQVSLTVPIESSKPCPCRMITEFGHGTSTLLYTPCCFFLSQHTRLPWCSLTAKVAGHTALGTIIEWIIQHIPPWRFHLLSRGGYFNKSPSVNILQ